MTKIENYWIDDTPTLEDIQQAYLMVKEKDIIVKLVWQVFHYGYCKYITKKDMENMSAEEFYAKNIPHIYGM